MCDVIVATCTCVDLLLPPSLLITASHHLASPTSTHPTRTLCVRLLDTHMSHTATCIITRDVMDATLTHVAACFHAEHGVLKFELLHTVQSMVQHRMMTDATSTSASTSPPPAWTLDTRHALLHLLTNRTSDSTRHATLMLCHDMLMLCGERWMVWCSGDETQDAFAMVVMTVVRSGCCVHMICHAGIARSPCIACYITRSL